MGSQKIQFRLDDEAMMFLEDQLQEGESPSQGVKRLLLDWLVLGQLPLTTKSCVVREVNHLEGYLERIESRLERLEQSQGKRGQKGFGK